MPAAPEQLTAAQLDEVEPLWAQLHAHHAELAMPPAMRMRPLAASWGDRVVSEGHRGSGAGAALVAAARDWLRERGAAPMLIGVRESNAQALDFYARLGAQPAFVIMALP
jgi:GNAT superfamily N-acetyltransferase